MHITPYEKGNIFNKDPLRVRKLLLHRYEINKIEAKLKEKGLTLVPLKVYFKDSLVKIEIGMARGKKLYDKRADIAKLNRIQLHLDDLVTRMGQQLYEGQIAAEPLVTGRSPCQWCDYGFVCCHETGIGERALEAPAKPFEAPGQPEEGEEEQE